ncbi:MAG: pantoate--beta-alanine ligase [Spirochaetes bacterium]|nr:pantoate--beta-alanine ligase [Spirochaetota bacterium]
MKIINTISELRNEIAQHRQRNKKIGFVPTMGYLHQGHLSLVDISKQYSDYQVMSIFVNKMQFNDPKDYDTYPRDYERDFALAKGAGVDLIFLPDDSQMYQNRLTYVDIEMMTDHLCGATRPGHFRGVLTVVAKLFNIVQPDVSVFGQKDIQQAVIIQKMVKDLNFPVKIIVAPIIREPDGLAMSSRNVHLKGDDRTNAVFIYKSLQKAQQLIAQGVIQANTLIPAITDIISQGKPKKIDYVSVVDYETLQPIETLKDKSVIAVAAFFGPTRLIDNMIVEKQGDSYRCVY